jgi:GMP synthase (glutamine-hydrolysing)
VPVLHWHGDTFTLPEGRSCSPPARRYRHQAFRRGRAACWRCRFHAEMGEDERFEDWIAQDMIT